MFKDDLNSDLHSVFFGDFNNKVNINGIEVIGYLDTNAYRWADIDSTQYIFVLHGKPNLLLERDQTLHIDNHPYIYVRHYINSDVTHIVVSRR